MPKSLPRQPCLMLTSTLHRSPVRTGSVNAIVFAANGLCPIADPRDLPFVRAVTECRGRQDRQCRTGVPGCGRWRVSPQCYRRRRHADRFGDPDRRGIIGNSLAVAHCPHARRPFFALSPSDRADTVRVEPPDRLLSSVGEPCDPPSGRVAREPRDIVLPNDRRSVKPNEEFGVQAFLKGGHRMVDQPTSPPHMKTHIVALRRNAIDIRAAILTRPERSDAQNSSSQREAFP